MQSSAISRNQKVTTLQTIRSADRAFARHYHEDMQEVFVIVQGAAEAVVGRESVTLQRGDAILIDPHEVHQMSNPGANDDEVRKGLWQRDLGGVVFGGHGSCNKSGRVESEDVISIGPDGRTCYKQETSGADLARFELPGLV